ncbi:cell wall protein DAN4-like [Micropterus salmoides]|uniref:cell wall protein DAN4-like n=1 Tax=Micropterus salmoides TaxID=27706 RepID=UPI0018EDC164|nr:cell wall protein DAN4-like [Micropterus salmoides]
MPAVMHLTMLLSLFAVTVYSTPANSTTSSAAKQSPETTTGVAQHTSLAVTKDVTSSTMKPTNTQQSTTAVTTEKVSPPPSTTPQTPNRTEETPTNTPPQTTTTNQTSNETVSHVTTLPPTSSNVTATTTINTTGPALSHNWKKDDLAANPGLVAILCIFCIVLVLVLVVATVKCIRSPRSNFERLDDVPLGNVNEESPFAHYSK